uniref:Methionine synthase n=1 Tax=Cyanothece sp. (strain PCC 7425 / ATCC 29141) TaxID=395961 RepID=B8HT85_CYAP4
MTRGIYILANDRVLDPTIALLNSIRLYNTKIPIFLIPFNQDYSQTMTTLGRLYGVQIFPNLERLEHLTQMVAEIFDQEFLPQPNKLRKLAVWFGPLDEFIYIDTDIVVFTDIAQTLNHLATVDFFCCDYHHAGEGLRNIFSPLVKQQQIFTAAVLEDMFNSGFWGSKTGVITEESLRAILQECSQHRDYFDFSQGATDQPLLNYLVLKQLPQRRNLVKVPGGGPGSWAGSSHFERRNDVLYDRGQRLQYLHWAGITLRPGCPYWDLWQHYRYLHEPAPSHLQKLTRRLFSFAALPSSPTV